MAIYVRIPTPLRTLTAGKEQVEAKGGTVREIIEDLERNQNEEDIRFLDGLETAVKDGDAISVVPAIAGGR